MEKRTDFSRVFRHWKMLIFTALGSLFILYLASGFYSVKPEQRGVVKRFGRVIDDNVMPGIHYRWPWPVESVKTPRTTEIRSLEVIFEDLSSRKMEQGAGALLTGDENFLLVRILVQYTIKHPGLYLYSTTDPDLLLTKITEESTVSMFAEMSIDDVMTVGRQKIQVSLKSEIQDRADEYELGIRITAIQLQGINPPPDVESAFKDVASAREDKHRVIQQAKGERNRRLPKARSDADRMISEAHAHRKEVVEIARGDASRFLAGWEEYRKAKSITATRLHLETMELIFPRVKKLITNPEAEKNIRYPGFHRP
jgi:modulator of FtsH protease HflK